MAKKTIKIQPDSFPGIDTVCKIYNENKGLVHASNIIAKVNNTTDSEKYRVREDKLKRLVSIYLEYLEGQLELVTEIIDYRQNVLSPDKKDLINKCIEQRVMLLNKYYDSFAELDIEGDGDEFYDSRSKIRSTILEEFMFLLFKEFVESLTQNGDKKVLKNGSTKAYSNLYFTAPDINEFVCEPSIQINTKNQDYAIYREVEIGLKGSHKKSQKAAIPILAIENKTYLDKTMLEGAIATAEKIKMGAPYSVFVVVTETYAVDNSVDPVYSRIDQIYVLRKCKEEDRNKNEVKVDVVQNMFWFVIERLMRPWSEVGEKVKKGFII